MIEVYAWMILNGSKKLEEIPAELVEEVQQVIVKLTTKLQTGSL